VCQAWVREYNGEKNRGPVPIKASVMGEGRGAAKQVRTKSETVEK
jgi:hypothetical protein